MMCDSCVHYDVCKVREEYEYLNGLYRKGLTTINRGCPIFHTLRFAIWSVESLKLIYGTRSGGKRNDYR